MAVVGMPAVVVPILGPVVGGLIISNTDWRWIFFINIPICLIGLVLAWRGLPESSRQNKAGLDITGLVLLSPALAGMLYGLSQVGAEGGFVHTSVIAPSRSAWSCSPSSSATRCEAMNRSSMCGCSASVPSPAPAYCSSSPVCRCTA